MLARAHRLDDLRVVLLDVDAADLVARDHDVVDRHFLQVENVQQHALVARRDHRAGLADDGAQLLGTERVLRALVGVDAEQLQQPVGDLVDAPHRGIKHVHQRVQHVGRGEGDALGVQRGQRLRRHLADDQHQDRHCAGGDRDSRIAPYPQRDHGADRRGEDVDEVVADQDQPDQAVRTLEQPRGETGAAVVLAQMLQPVAVERHHPGFGTGEECRHQKAGNENAEQQFQRGIVQAQGCLLSDGTRMLKKTGGHGNPIVRRALQAGRCRTSSSTNLLPK